MAEPTENTFTAYLGPEFQQRLMWQLLVEPEFAEKALPNLGIDYFDDPNLKRLYIIILEYYREFGKVPNLQNQSIYTAINKYKTPNNKIEEESLFSVIKRVELWNERVINKQMLHDGDAVQRETNTFIKQQEWRKFAEFILEKTKNGEIKKKYILGEIDEKLIKISHIGDDEDYGTEVTENIGKALRKEFRKTIPTGISVIDSLTGGGLGKGEFGLILTPSGVGKTTALTKIANTAYEQEYNVLQIIFEDTVEQIQRKHFAIWSKYKLSEIDENNTEVERLVNKHIEESHNRGHLVIKRFSQENTTMTDIRNWILRYQKKWGYKFDIVILDYLDCLESHKKTPDRNEAELAIVKSFEAMAADFDIPAWSAIQSNRSGFDAELVEAHQTGGSIKRVQKAHFFMSVAKTADQKEAHLASIRIIKARFAQDGQTFKDCIFNNDTMEIRIEDARYANAKPFRALKKYDSDDIDKLEKHADNIDEKPSPNIIMHTHISQFADRAVERANDDTVNDTEKKKITDYSPTEINDLLKRNNEKTTIDNIQICTERTDLTENELKEIVNFTEEVLNENENLLTLENTTTDTAIIEMPPLIEEITDVFDDCPFEWTGKSETVTLNEPKEVKLEDIPPVIQPKIENNLPVENKTEINYDEMNRVFTPEKTEETEKKSPQMSSLSQTGGSTFLIDPDAPSDACAQILNILDKKGKEQGNIKKE